MTINIAIFLTEKIKDLVKQLLGKIVVSGMTIRNLSKNSGVMEPRLEKP